MRKVTFGGAKSLDNYFAGKDGRMDWLLWSDEAIELMNDYWPKVDCVTMISSAKIITKQTAT